MIPIQYSTTTAGQHTSRKHVITERITNTELNIKMHNTNVMQERQDEEYISNKIS
jgi:hypothetical protein